MRDRTGRLEGRVRGDWIEAVRQDEPLIDLGVLGDEPRPRRSRRWRPRVTALQRRIAAVVLAVALALLTQGSTVGAAPPLGAPLWTMSVQREPMVTPDVVVVRKQHADYYSALDRATGRERFRFPGGLTVEQVQQFWPGGPIAASVSPGPLAESQQVAVLDPVTGRMIGKGVGFAVGAAGGGDVILLDGFGLGDCPAVAGLEGVSVAASPCEQIGALDGRTGRTLWQRTTGDGDLVGFETDNRTGLISSVGIATAVGDFVDYDAVTGAEVWRGTAPAPVYEALTGIDDNPGDVIVSGQRVVYVYYDGNVVRATSYARGQSTPEWDQVLDGALAPRGGGSCGVYLCLYTDDGLWLLDSRTGAELLHTRVGSIDFLAPDTLAMTTFDSQQETTTFFDLPSGQPKLRLPIDRRINWPNSGGRVIGMRGVGSGQTLYLIRPDGTSEALGRIDGSTSDLGSAQCAAEGDLLACNDIYGLMRVWRLPS